LLSFIVEIIFQYKALIHIQIGFNCLFLSFWSLLLGNIKKNANKTTKDMKCNC